MLRAMSSVLDESIFEQLSRVPRWDTINIFIMTPIDDLKCLNNNNNNNIVIENTGGNANNLNIYGNMTPIE